MIQKADCVQTLYLLTYGDEFLDLLKHSVGECCPNDGDLGALFFGGRQRGLLRAYLCGFVRGHYHYGQKIRERRGGGERVKNAH